MLDLTPHGARLVLATKRHARELGRIMRAKDREEGRAAGNFTPEASVRMSINNSCEAYAAYVGDYLLCVFGVGPMHGTPEITVAWIMTSVHVDRYPLTFYRCSKIVIEYLRGKYPIMVNMIHGQYTEALRWLERLGFKLGPPEPFGVRGDLHCRAMLVTNRIEVIGV